jgi:hypothetical protein
MFPDIITDETKEYFKDVGKVLKDGTLDLMESVKNDFNKSVEQGMEGIDKLIEGDLKKGAYDIGSGFAKFIDLFNPLAGPVEYFFDIDKDKNYLRADNAFKYVFGEPGKDSPMLGDLANAFDRAVKSDIGQSVAKGSKKVTDSMSNAFDEFGKEIKLEYEEFTGFLTDTVKKVKDFFSFDTIQRITGIGTKNKVNAKPVTKAGENLKRIRKDVIDELADSGITAGGEPFEHPFSKINRKYVDLNPQQKTLVDNRVDSILREGQPRKLQGPSAPDFPGVEGPPIIIPEKDADKISMGAKMRSGAVNPLTLAPLINNSPSNNTTVNNVDSSSTVSNTKVSGGGGGGITTRPIDTGLYSNLTVPSFMQAGGGR